MRVITSNQILDRLRHSDEVIAYILRITLMRYRHLLQQMRRAEDSSTQISPANEELAIPNSRDAVAKLELENELREALDNGELRLHFQPLVALSDQHLASRPFCVGRTRARGLCRPGQSYRLPRRRD